MPVFNTQGQVVNSQATQDWLNAAGIYLESNENGPTVAHVDLGSYGVNGFFGELQMPPKPSDRMKFIDDPVWKHWLKLFLIALVIGLLIMDGYKLLK